MLLLDEEPDFFQRIHHCIQIFFDTGYSGGDLVLLRARHVKAVTRIE